MTSFKGPVRTYFERMAEVRSTGGATSETSYYSALENLLNDLGGSLKPRVICNGQLRSQGAGHPDFGLYTQEQCNKGAPKTKQSEIPARGVIEVKPLADNSWQTAQGEQTTRYFNLYRLVLVTNYREFRLIGADDGGKPVQREFFSLAPDEAEFWSLAKHPVTSANAHATHLGEFLHRLMMHATPLTRPKDVAQFLASYARDALATLTMRDDVNLAPLRKALEIALGTKFDGQKGKHFFRSTLIQTLFYGIFSAWVIHARGGGGTFDWKSAGYTMTVPMIRALFEEVAKPSRIKLLGLKDILDRTGEALNRVDRMAFFKTFDSGKAVQHFYEPFLEAFDPELRKQMGVWYTPREIVRYMVERTDTVLRTELGIADGLANENVFVLDPCCGTGAYVVEVLRKIEENLRAAKGEDALIGEDVREAACKRVFGFEIMSAPFIIAHWQVGKLLEDFGAPVDPSKNERPAIYLTNALTGWEPLSGAKSEEPLFPELQEERDKANDIKLERPILVVLGNPPYNAFAGTSPEEEDGLVEPYKEGLVSHWKIKKFNLDDLYVRFFRIAERRITKTGRGIVSYISNYSWTYEPSYVVMRENLLQSFDKFWIENMHGDRNKTEYAPDGTTSETIFAMPGFSPGIRQGVVISLAVKTGEEDEPKVVRYRDDIDAGRAEARKQQLLDSLSDASFDDRYDIADPQTWNRLSFRPRNVGDSYLSWPTLSDLAEMEPINGLMEKRGGGLIDIDHDALANRMQDYFNKDIDWPDFKRTKHPLAEDAARYSAKDTRTKALVKKDASFDDEKIVRYIVHPFDVRHAYYTGIRPIWNESRPTLWTQFEGGNQFLMTRKSCTVNPEGPPVFFTQCLGNNGAQRGNSYYIPFKKHNPAHGMLGGTATTANLSENARLWLKHLGLPDTDTDAEAAAAPWRHALAVTFSPQYLGDNADGLAIDWPRVPLPNKRTLLDTSTTLGARVEALLNSETDVPGVTGGRIAEHLRILGSVSSTDLQVTAGWGRLDKMGKVYPGKGRTEMRDWTEIEISALHNGFAAEGIAAAQGLGLLGQAVDVYLNDTTCWQGVPETVWAYVIGGHQVIKKWLSYREEAILGRSVTKGEARHVTAMVRRLTSLILMTDELDKNYAACRDNAYSHQPASG